MTILRHRWFVIMLTLAGGCASVPEGTAGPAADALAREVETAVNKDAWDETGVVVWDFDGRNQHLWDKKREWIRVRWDDCEVRRHLWTPRGKAWCEGAEVTDQEELTELMDSAYARWVNDAYWLNPLVKFFDKGVTRKWVDHEEGRALLITYSSGGLTPGDSYLWFVGEDGLPTAWRMWVSILPIKGVFTSWEGWKELEGGAKVSTVHKAGPFTMQMNGVAAAATVEELEGEDPFAGLAP